MEAAGVMNAQTMIVIAYCAVFVWAAYAARQGWRIVTAFAAYAVLAGASGMVLPGVLGFGHRQNLFLLPACIALALWLPPPRQQDAPWSKYLRLAAESAAVMASVWLALLAVEWWQYPEKLSIFVLTGLLQLVLWQPLFWIVGQWVLMAVWHASGAPRDKKAAFLLALIWFALYLAADLFGVL